MMRAWQCFRYKIENKARKFTITTSSQHCTRSLTNAVRKEKKIEGIFGKKKKKDWKGKIKLPLFADDMIIYVENQRESIKKATRT